MVYCVFRVFLLCCVCVYVCVRERGREGEGEEGEREREFTRGREEDSRVVHTVAVSFFPLATPSTHSDVHCVFSHKEKFGRGRRWRKIF